MRRDSNLGILLTPMLYRRPAGLLVNTEVSRAEFQTGWAACYPGSAPPSALLFAATASRKRGTSPGL